MFIHRSRSLSHVSRSISVFRVSHRASKTLTIIADRKLKSRQPSIEPFPLNRSRPTPPTHSHSQPLLRYTPSCVLVAFRGWWCYRVLRVLLLFLFLRTNNDQRTETVIDVPEGEVSDPAHRWAEREGSTFRRSFLAKALRKA